MSAAVGGAVTKEVCKQIDKISYSFIFEYIQYTISDLLEQKEPSS